MEMGQETTQETQIPQRLHAPIERVREARSSVLAARLALGEAEDEYKRARGDLHHQCYGTHEEPLPDEQVLTRDEHNAVAWRARELRVSGL